MTENENTTHSGGKLLIVNHQFPNGEKRTVSMLFKDRRLLKLQFDTQSNIGNIYIGKVKNISESAGAYFVEIFKGELCYLSFHDIEQNTFVPILNRKWDGNIQPGDEILVQVVKEAIKTKLPSVSTRISLTGKYVVLSLGNRHLGISNKIASSAKKILTEYLKEKSYVDQDLLCRNCDNIAPEYGIILRTNAANTDDLSLVTNEIDEFEEQIALILHQAGTRTCFSCLYREIPNCIKSVRDVYDSLYEEVVTDCPEIYDTLVSFVDLGKLSVPVRFYDDKMVRLEKLYNVDSSLKAALKPRVWLKSGGYILIEPTEALTTIDVNSGKYECSGAKYSKAAIKINLEAADELILQLQLRNISGIIIVDFISMDNHEDNEKLMNHLKKLCKKDSVATEVVDMTKLGLVEITRKKINKPLKEQIESIMEDTETSK